MSKIQELREKRGKALADARAINEAAAKENRNLTDEENFNYTKAMDEFHGLGDQLKRAQELDREERALAQIADEQLDADVGVGAGAGAGETREVSPEEAERRAFQGFTAWCQTGELREFRALQVDADIAGGYLQTPEQVVNRLLTAVDNRTFIRQYATIFRVPNAESLGVPSLDADPADPTRTTEILSGNLDTAMSFGKRKLTPTPYAVRLKSSATLLRKVPSAGALVEGRLAYKMGIVDENSCLNGTGANEPLGLFTASANGISTGRDVSTSNTTTAITIDNLKSVKGTLKQQYRMRPSTRWVFHRDAMTAIGKLKDGNGRYLLEDDIKNADQPRLLGIPVEESEYAPNTFTTGLYVGLLGDLSYFWIADSLDLRIKRVDELYAETDQVGFFARAEDDGMPVLEEAFVRVKLA